MICPLHITLSHTDLLHETTDVIFSALCKVMNGLEWNGVEWNGME